MKFFHSKDYYDSNEARISRRVRKRIRNLSNKKSRSVRIRSSRKCAERMKMERSRSGSHAGASRIVQVFKRGKIESSEFSSFSESSLTTATEFDIVGNHYGNYERKRGKLARVSKRALESFSRMIPLSRKRSKNLKLPQNVEYPERKEKSDVVRNINKWIFPIHTKQNQKMKTENFDVTDNSDDVVSKNIVTFLDILFDLFGRLIYCTSKDDQSLQEAGVVINNGYATTKEMHTKPIINSTTDAKLLNVSRDYIIETSDTQSTETLSMFSNTICCTTVSTPCNL